jgi:hypothetical protein
LPNGYVLGGWIATQMYNVGNIEIIPQLWLAQRQLYSICLSGAMDFIQKQEGLYNPNFSDRQSRKIFPSCSLYPRLRQVLLRDLDKVEMNQ